MNLMNVVKALLLTAFRFSVGGERSIIRNVGKDVYLSILCMLHFGGSPSLLLYTLHIIRPETLRRKNERAKCTDINNYAYERRTLIGQDIEGLSRESAVVMVRLFSAQEAAFSDILCGS